MKKLFSLALAFCLCGAANAQTETYFGAEKGSFAVSIDAMPFVNYAGNFFGKTNDNKLDLSNIASEVAAKYFVTENWAVAARFGIKNNKTVTPAYAGMYYLHNDPIGKTTEKVNEFNLALGAQYYLRPGKRVQPFVGASVFVGRKNSTKITEEYTYAIKDANNMEEKREFSKTTKDANPNTFFGVAANLGVEFFVSKNISLSTEFDLGVKTTTSKTVKELESSDTKTYTAEVLKQENFSKKTGNKTEFATGLMGGKLAVNFYF